MRDLYQQDTKVYRIFDPIEGKFCCSGRGLYAQNGRSVWLSKSSASLALKHMPKDVKDRLIVKEYSLVEVSHEQA